MPHVLVAGELHSKGLALLDAEPSVTYDYVKEISEASYAKLVGKAEALAIRTQPCSAETIAKAGRLRIVSRHGVGYDAVDLEALNGRNIALAVVDDVNSVSVAEHALMLLLATAKRVPRAGRALQAGDWGWRNRFAAREVDGMRLLIVGYGRIGRHLARMAAGFAMEVRAYDPLLVQAGWPEGAVRPVEDLEAGLAWADAVSVHAPKGPAPIIGAEELAAMRPDAFVVNTARGGVVCESALIDALEAGRLAGAGLDVFEDEPPAPDHPLMSMDQVLVTPHIAGLTAECAERMAISCIQNILDFFEGRLDPRLIVNAAMLRPTAGR